MAKFFYTPAIFIALAAAAAPQDASAWAVQGHYMIGELAQRQLQPNVQAEVSQLLAGEKNPSLGGVASWADNLRQEDGARFRTTSRWHYINAKGGGCDFQLARDCPGGNCAVSAIEDQAKILGDRNQSLEARRDALKFVVHFVGDLHQPLHAGNRTDSGGNSFQVSLRTTIQPESYARKSYVNGVMGTNLHSVWDYYIFAAQDKGNLEYSNTLDARGWPAVERKHKSTLPLDWARQSCQLIDKKQIYPSKHVMDHGYLHKHQPLAEKQVRIAGQRLAELINRTLGTP